MSNEMSDILMPKGPPRIQDIRSKEAVMDRLRRRLGGYRKHHNECGPRFEQTTNGLNDQQRRETMALRQKFLEAKAKKSAKKSDKNKTAIPGSDTSGSKLQKRPCEDTEGSGNEYYEPPAKISIGNNAILGSPSKPHISGNSSVHNKCNKSASSDDKYGILSPSDPPSGPASNTSNKVSTNAGQVSGSPLIDHYSIGNNGPSSNSSNYSAAHTPNPAFVDLDQCAAALEKDAAENGSLSGLIGVNDYDTLKDLISEISDNPDFNFDDFADDHADSINKSTFPETNKSSADDPGVFAGLSNRSCTPPVAMSSSSANSPRVSQVKLESDTGSLHGNNPQSVDSNIANRLSHCSGASPATSSIASPMAGQPNSHPSQTPPYSASSTFESASASPGSSQLQNPLTPRSNKNFSSNKNPSSNVSGNTTAATKATRIPYTSPGNLSMESPAAQTLKQMAEQHQHKAQLGMGNFPNNPNSNSSPARSPYNGDAYGNMHPNCEFNTGGNPSASSSSLTNFNNIPNRPNQPGGVPNDNMAMNMPIKQENIMYSSQNNMAGSELKRNVSNHPLPSQQPLTPPQTQQQQQHKLSPSNNQRMPTPNAMPTNHPPSSYANKSFMPGGPNVSGAGMNMNGGGQQQPGQMPPYKSRPNSHMGMNTGPPNSYPPTSTYQGNLNQSQGNMNPQQMSQMQHQNPAAVMQNNPQGLPGGPGMGDMKLKGSMARMPNYQYTQGQNQGHHLPMHMQQQSQQQCGPESAGFMHSNPAQGGSNIGSNTHGQTINFTQQHLKMPPSSGMQNPQMMSMNRMPGPGGPGHGPSGPGPGPGGVPRMPMNDMSNMNARMEMQMQQRMMRAQMVRAQAPQPTQQSMMRTHSPDLMSQQQHMQPGNGPMMPRFPKVGQNPISGGPGRPSMTSHNSMNPNQVMEQPTNPSMQNMRMPQNSYMGMNSGMMPNQMNMGNSQMMNGGGNMNPGMAATMKPNNMNMPMRRMPFNPSQGMGMPPTSQGIMNRPSMNPMNQGMGMSNMSQQQSMASSQEWMSMSDPNSRNYRGGNPQQAMRPQLRPTNSGPYPHGMGMSHQSTQSHHTMGSHREVPNPGVTGPMQMPGNQGGMGGNPMANMNYNTPPHHGSMPMGPNRGNFSQVPVNKLPSNQMNMCSSDFQMKANDPSASNGGGNGALMCANPQPSMNHQMNMNSNNADVTNPDFNLYLLDNMASNNDASSYNEESDFLSTFDSNSNYQQIFDSL